MNDNELDIVLSQTEEIIPSSGFSARVMDAVRQEAAIPPPIPFPWRRAMPGLVACVGLVAFLIYRFGHLFSATPADASSSLPAAQWLPTLLFDVDKSSAFLSLEWLAIALLITFATLWLSMRFAE